MRTTVSGGSDEVVQQVEAADESLRKSFSGMDVDEILPEVRRSVTEIGLSLTDDEVRTWAQHISDRTDHQLTLR